MPGMAKMIKSAVYVEEKKDPLSIGQKYHVYTALRGPDQGWETLKETLTARVRGATPDVQSYGLMRSTPHIVVWPNTRLEFLAQLRLDLADATKKHNRPGLYHWASHVITALEVLQVVKLIKWNEAGYLLSIARELRELGGVHGRWVWQEHGAIRGGVYVRIERLVERLHWQAPWRQDE